jgi:hypothetical protein
MDSSFASRYANAREGKFQFRLRQDIAIELAADGAAVPSHQLGDFGIRFSFLPQPV